MIRDAVWYWAALACSTCALALASPVPAPVTFSVTTNTAAGQSMFVVGDQPSLGGWDPTRAHKLVAVSCAGSNCEWSAVIGIPEDTAYQYKFVRRQDCVACYADAANVEWESGANRTNATPVGPAPPFSGKTVLYLSGWTAVSIIYSNTASGSFEVAPMRAAGPGRTGGETLWRVDGLNAAGEPAFSFLFTDNLGHFDNPDGAAGLNYVTPLDACLVQDGQVYNYWPAPVVSPRRIDTFPRSFTNLPGRTIRVYLPRGYNEHTSRRYPVLYMHDGQNLFQGMGTFGCWNADTNADHLIRFGQMRETIIVGVDNNADRLREYTPPACTAPQGGSALGGRYAGLLIDELKPFIDGFYRTLPDAANTGILGSSMGGLMSAWLGWQYPDIFRRVGAMSSSFWVCNPIPAPDTPRPIRVYLDSGDTNDDLDYTMEARDNLIRNGYVLNQNLFHMIGFGHSHSETFWDRRLPGCFTFLFPTRDEPNSILDARAHPPRLTASAPAGASNVVEWTSYRGRRYAVEGTTGTLAAAMWTNILNAAGPEERPWNYQGASVTNGFPFLRVRQEPDPGWL